MHVDPDHFRIRRVFHVDWITQPLEFALTLFYRPPHNIKTIRKKYLIKPPSPVGTPRPAAWPYELSKTIVFISGYLVSI
jgi:hypothetical protein